MKDKGTKHPKEMEKEALLKDKKDRKPGELKDEELEKLSGGEGMNTGNIINP